MPTQLPLESTVYFGSKLLPLVPELLEVDAKKDFEKQTHISRAIRDVSKPRCSISPKDRYDCFHSGNAHSQRSIDTEIQLHHAITRAEKVH